MIYPNKKDFFNEIKQKFIHKTMIFDFKDLKIIKVIIVLDIVDDDNFHIGFLPDRYNIINYNIEKNIKEETYMMTKIFEKLITTNFYEDKWVKVNLI